MLTKDQKFNLWINLGDGAFFGFALGFVSFMTILPLFVSTMTDSALLIGLIPAIRAVGWELPQLFAAQKLSGMTRFKPLVMKMTLHERLPFLPLALVAFLIPVIGVRIGLVLTFTLLIWQGLGGGLTANPWQSMIGKIIPAQMLGTFFGFQAAVANLLASVSAAAAGLLLVRLASPGSYSLLFLLAFGAMCISYVFLASNREQSHVVADNPALQLGLGVQVMQILRKDRNFRWYLAARFMAQFALLGLSFYTVYAVDKLGMSVVNVGIMTSVFLGTQIIMNPLMGWLGDHWSYLWVTRLGMVAAVASAVIAWQASDPNWFYLAYILAGIGIVALYTIGLALTMQFGTEAERPTYIGMNYTLVVPASALAPLMGGWLADHYGYPLTFLFTALCGVVTLVLYLFFVHPPKNRD